MYRGFTINYSSVKRLFDNDHNHKWAYYYGIGRRVVRDKSKKVFKKVLDKFNYITEDILDGTDIQDDWFPKKQCDIFISHSHKDEELAITLAGWLWYTFKLKAFVDSCIWGYADELVEILLEEMDESVNDNNYITSHVHNMLTVALMEMIDKTECLFFLKTPNSTFFDGTLSPWIYTEIEISKMIQKRSPQRQKQISDSTKKFSIFYDVDLSHLTEINSYVLNTWQKLYKNEGHALNILYNLTKQR